MDLYSLVSTRTRSSQLLLDGATSRAAQVVSLHQQWASPREVSALTGQLSSLVDASVRAEASKTHAYLHEAYLSQGVRPQTPRLSISGSLRSGVSSGIAYQRVPGAARYALSQGASTSDALAAAVERVTSMIAQDIAMGRREQARRFFMSNQRTTDGYRRVIRPELSGGNVCGLCIVASDRVYSRSDLMPLHTKCNCDVLPIIGHIDPGLRLNRGDLDTLYDSAGGNDYKKLRKLQVQVSDHGELGPTLTRVDQEFRDIAEVEKAMAISRTNFDTRIAELDRQISDMEALIASQAPGRDTRKLPDLIRRRDQLIAQR